MSKLEEAIKKNLIAKVNAIKESDIKKRTDDILHITYYIVKIGKGELIIPESSLPFNEAIEDANKNSSASC